MKDLKKFRSCTIAQTVEVPSGVDAYRMDDKDNDKDEDMREFSGLAEVSCCDYVLVKKDYVALIEDTYLQGKVNELAGECHALIEDTYLQGKVNEFAGECRGLDPDKVSGYILKYLRVENTLKFYGAMLVLCRLSAKFPSVREALDGKPYKFWVVATSGKGIPDKHVLHDYGRAGTWIGKLAQNLVGLKGAFPEIETVRVVSVADLEEII